ncbi:MAG: TonB-dependent receptor [Pseudomonadota bacterium]
MKPSLCIALILSAKSFAQNEVEVKGTLKNRQDVLGIGQSTRLETRDASGLLISDLANDSSFLSNKSLGAGSASGFDSLSIRHQDAKNTEIWLDGFLIDDPLTNFPLALNTDLASLGFVKIHSGPGPLSITSSSPAGSVEISSSKSEEPTFLGLSKGNIYGESLFGRLGRKDKNTNSSLYLRSHKSSGVYPFYYDNLTPYNTSDDTVKKRNSNESLSDYGLIRFGYQNDLHRLNLMGMKENSSSSLPTPDNMKSFARTNRNLDFMNLMYQLGDREKYFQLSLLWNQSKRETMDPCRTILANSNIETLDSESLKKSLGYFYSKEDFKFNLQVAESETKIDQREEASQINLSRALSAASSGIEDALNDTFSLRSKLRNTWIQDQKSMNLIKNSALDSSLSLLAHLNDNSFWMTVAYQDRPPSLLEMFGSSSTILGNPNLDAENSRLWELGVNMQGTFWRGSASLHKIITADKIIFVRAGSNAIKGQNIEKSQLTGVSLSAEQDLFPLTLKQSIYLSNTVDQKFKRGLPFEPWALATLAAEFRVSGQMTAGAEAHYKSEYFRDINGDSISPQSAQWDTFMRYAWQKWDIALNINNVGNEMSQKFLNRQSGESGATSISDYEGHPLPGRQIRVSTLYRF